MDYRERVEAYKAWYISEYKHPPSEKLIEEYCRIHGIPWPLPRIEVEEVTEAFWRGDPLAG